MLREAGLGQHLPKSYVADSTRYTCFSLLSNAVVREWCVSWSTMLNSDGKWPADAFITSTKPECWSSAVTHRPRTRHQTTSDTTGSPVRSPLGSYPAAPVFLASHHAAAGFDFRATPPHTWGMSFDMQHLLDAWQFQAGQIAVRKFKGQDGVGKIQMRVDLGILQMNATGRPDGKKPLGHPSLLEHYEARRRDYGAKHGGNHDDFALKGEDCMKLQLEALQYHHRSICLLQLNDFAGVVRDTERNMAVFDLVSKHAETEEMAWALEQFRPQLLMMHTRAAATQRLQASDFRGAVQQIEDGLNRIRSFYTENEREEMLELSDEIRSLEAWLEEIQESRPLTPREKLERALEEAVNQEDYEKAAAVRDALRDLKE